ncbi:A24 family peptidase [Jatrophihabitans sp.]|uniref:A24 family peptidase n=1 Tax=Jatrophihabitans sp. TaxID=1932789 RepID=UPI0030C75FD3|nr:prepilin peptidase [Jatrophihabitans sp.]
MSTTALGAGAGALFCLAASPYLARLTLSVPDRDSTGWWRGAPASAARLRATAAVALLLGALAGAAARWSVLLPALLGLALVGTALVVIDLEHHRLPNRLVGTAAVAGAVLLALAAGVRHDWPHYLRAVEGGAAVYAVLFLIAFLAPRSFGLGDVRLGGVLGFYLGYHGWLAVYYGIFAGFLVGTVVAVVLLVSGRATRKTPVPFGPMLIVGTLGVLALNISTAVG